jgi:outer membrane protein TolC
VLTWWIGVGARAQEPVSLTDVLQAALSGNAALVEAGFDRDQAAGALLAARGQFDPMYLVQLGATRSKTVTFDFATLKNEQGNGWFFDQQLTGDLGTGTSWALDLALARDYRDTVTGSGPTAVEEVRDSYASGLTGSVTQQLLRGFRYSYNVQHVTLARADLDLAELTVEKQRQAALFAAQEAYWGWLYAYQSEQIAQDAVSVAQEALRVGQVQLERGQLANVEVTRLEAALVQAQQDELDARNASEQAANALLVAIGRDPGTDVLPSTLAGEVPALDIDPAQAVQVALAQNLDLALARKALERAELDSSNARHALLPELSLTASASTGATRCRDSSCASGDALEAVAGLFAGEQPEVQLSGQFDVPIGNRAARGDRDSAAAVVERRKMELADLERAVSAEVEDQVRTLASAGQRVSLADANLRLAQDTLAGEEALMAVGRTIQKNVLEARNAVAQARVDLSRAHTDFELAQARLLQLQGQLTVAGAP